MSNESNKSFAKLESQYLILNRENYIEEQEDMYSLFESVKQDFTCQDIKDILTHSFDWRKKIVGIYLAIAQRNPLLVCDLCEMLFNRNCIVLRRPIILSLALIGGNPASDQIKVFLMKPYDEESFHEYVAAIEAANILKCDVVTLENDILERLRNDGISNAEIDISRIRFRKAFDYWQRQEPEKATY